MTNGRIRTNARFAAVLVDRDLEEHEQAVVADFLTGALVALERARDVAPHAVHLEERTIVTPDVDEDGSPIVRDGVAMVTRTMSEAAASCPDCGRPTQGRAGTSETLVCPSLELVQLALEPCHPDCLIACGRSSTDG